MMRRRRIYSIWQGVFALVIILVGIGGTSGVQGASPVTAFCTSSFKLMPLGDSLTTGKYSGHDISDPAPPPGGEHDDIGYRKDLYDLLTTSGYSVDFVGTESNGSTFPFSDPEHEGHNGWKDEEIAQNIYDYPGGINFLASNPPDVILLHIGTNEPRNKAWVEEILDEINDYEMDEGRTVIVIVARIIDKDPYDGSITTYNNAVQTMVEARPDFGSELFLVDMEDGAGLIYSMYPAGDMLPDGIHLYETGYTKMANLWKREIDKICENTPQLIHPGAQISEESEYISLHINTNVSDDFTFSSSSLPPSLSINGSTGRITGTIQNGAHSGSPYKSKVYISDDLGELDRISFSWTVYDMQHFFLPIAVNK